MHVFALTFWLIDMLLFLAVGTHHAVPLQLVQAVVVPDLPLP